MEKTLGELIEEWGREHKTSNTEGETGVKNLARLVNNLGYVDRTYFGQFQGASYGDLINFLEDNPGAVEAVQEWIIEQDDEQWKENLESYLTEEDQ